MQNTFFTNSFNNDTSMNKFNAENLDVMNPAPRCPVVLLLDVSGSMSGEPINELNEGLRQFIQETAEDEAASMSVELEVITFGTTANVAIPFTPMTGVERNPTPFYASGLTAMGAALRKATADLKARKHLYKTNGISAYRPWVILMTDGGPNDEWTQAAAEMRQMGENGKIQYIGIEIGSEADHNTMCQILPANPGPVKLQGLKFKQFFRWLTDSLRSVSSSAVSDQDNVQYGTIRNWADLSGI